MATLDKVVRREIGQHVVFGFNGHEINDNVRNLITQYYVGNIILMRRNIRDAEQSRQLIKSLQLLAKEAGHPQPLLVGIDQENGLVSAFSSPTAGTQFPGAMAQAETRDIELTRRVSSACGKELNLVGIKWTYGPVADVNSDFRNPVIGVRSFGDDAKIVGRFTKAASEGFISSGIATCAKHFPGHGDTHVDSHLALPIINKTSNELFETDLPPFQELIDSGIPSIMTAHVALPKIVGDNTPASLSRLISTNLLREELGFRGVIVTDCLEMDAISAVEQGACGTEEGAVRALEAGADMAMICHTYQKQVGAIEQISLAVVSDRIAISDLKQSGERIISMKTRFVGDWSTYFQSQDIIDIGFTKDWKALKGKNANLSQEAYRKTTKKIADSESLLPVKLTTKARILLMSPAMKQINRAVDADGGLESAQIRNTATPYDVKFARILEEYGQVNQIVYTSGDHGPPSDPTFDLIVFVTRNTLRRKWQWSVLEKTVEKVVSVPIVVVASCDPYDFTCVDGQDKWKRVAFLATYEFTEEAFLAASKVIFG